MTEAFEPEDLAKGAKVPKNKKLKKTIITFSFDDGHPNDIKVSRLLKKYNLTATFYIPIRNSENPVLKPKEIYFIHSKGFEIGSHGLTHRRLTKLSFSEARNEIVLSKKMLEKVIKTKIRAFCFAGGKYNEFIARMPKEEGYLFARTTRLLRQDNPIEGSLMHTTMQYYPLLTIGYLKHLVRRPSVQAWELFLKSILDCGFNSSPITLAKYFIKRALRDQSCFHLHGHSYEFTSMDKWKSLEELFEFASAQKRCEFLNNSQAFQKLLDQNGGKK